MSFITERGLSIGDEFEYNGVSLTVVEDIKNECEGCYFDSCGFGCPSGNDFNTGCANKRVSFILTPHEVSKVFAATCSIEKVTSRELMLKACESTFIGKSNVGQLKMYISEHSPIRTQQYWIGLDNLPLFVSTHLLRHNVGSQPYALTHRVDRKGGEDLGRWTPTKLSMLINAQSLVDMAKVRLCKQASKETVLAMKLIQRTLADVDIDLAKVLVPKCVYRNGLCGELKPCGYNKSSEFKDILGEYVKFFKH